MASGCQPRAVAGRAIVCYNNICSSSKNSWLEDFAIDLPIISRATGITIRILIRCIQATCVLHAGSSIPTTPRQKSRRPRATVRYGSTHPSSWSRMSSKNLSPSTSVTHLSSWPRHSIDCAADTKKPNCDGNKASTVFVKNMRTAMSTRTHQIHIPTEMVQVWALNIDPGLLSEACNFM